MLENYELHEKGYNLVFEDHFEGDDLNPEVWNKVNLRQQGHDGSYAYRTDKPENVHINDSNLYIVGLDKSPDYTSGMINTSGKLGVKYGYLEIRCKLPKGGPGIWPGFWTRSFFPDAPGTLEIDVFEMFGNNQKIAGALHSWWSDKETKNRYHISYTMGNDYPNYYEMPNGGNFTDDYHTIGLEWTPEYICWLVDGHRYMQIDIDGDTQQSFHYPIHIIISMAVGLPFLAKPNEDTTFPAEYVVDYFKIYQNEKGKLFHAEDIK